MRIDLHTHSTASDGTDTPAELVAAAARERLDVIAITDHDTTDGWAVALAEGHRLGVRVVPGVEITTRAEGCSVHLLGYLPDARHPALSGVLANSREGRLGRMAQIVERMRAGGYDVTLDDVEAQVGPGATMGRPHLADALVAKGIVRDRSAAFASLISDSSPFYVPTPGVPDAVSAVRMVLAAGGVPVMAHPAAAERGPVVSEAVIVEMIEAGMPGIEVHHRDHDADARRRMTDLARAHGLFVTGSSDYHGTGKPNRIGENLTDPEVLAQIEELGSPQAWSVD